MGGRADDPRGRSAAQPPAGWSAEQVEAYDRVGVEQAKEMVRDARFYADPDVNPARRDLVLAAAAARAEGRTRAEFAAAQGLSASKAKEVWRDSGILAP